MRKLLDAAASIRGLRDRRPQARPLATYHLTNVVAFARLSAILVTSRVT